MGAGNDTYYGFVILKSDGAIHAKDSKKLILQLISLCLSFFLPIVCHRQQDILCNNSNT